MLVIENLTKSFNDRIILKNISLLLEPGKVYALLGANGAGKTTLFNILTGFIRPDDGKIFFNECNITKYSPVKINQLGISRSFQNLRMIHEFTVKENILLSYSGNKGEKIFNAFLPQKVYKNYYREFSEKADKIIERVCLKDVIKSKAGEISYGQQKLLTIGCCLATGADLYLFDEPVAGINPYYRIKIANLIKSLKDEGRTILLIEHSVDFIKDVSDILLFLAKGEISTFNAYEELKENSLVKKAYL